MQLTKLINYDWKEKVSLDEHDWKERNWQVSGIIFPADSSSLMFCFHHINERVKDIDQ